MKPKAVLLHLPPGGSPRDLTQALREKAILMQLRLQLEAEVGPAARSHLRIRIPREAHGHERSGQFAAA